MVAYAVKCAVATALVAGPIATATVVAWNTVKTVHETLNHVVHGENCALPDRKRREAELQKREAREREAQAREARAREARAREAREIEAQEREVLQEAANREQNTEIEMRERHANAAESRQREAREREVRKREAQEREAQEREAQEREAQESPEPCPICYSTIEEGEEKVTRCGHTFHENCINRWLEQNATCPICREDLSNQTQVKQLGKASLGKWTAMGNPEFQAISTDDTTLLGLTRSSRCSTAHLCAAI